MRFLGVHWWNICNGLLIVLWLLSSGSEAACAGADCGNCGRWRWCKVATC